jgi:hypothetical protein
MRRGTRRKSNAFSPAGTSAENEIAVRRCGPRCFCLKTVLASHSHDRTLLDAMLANGDSLRDYVQCKLAIWEGIFNDSVD